MKKIHTHIGGIGTAGMSRPVFLLFLFLVFASLPANLPAQSVTVDMIFLANDTVLTGLFERKEGDTIFFHPRSRRLVSVDAANMRGLVLGYKGLPACLELRSHPGALDCSTILFLYGERLLLARNGVLQEYQREEIARLSFRKTHRGNLILPLLRRGQFLRLRGTRESRTGKLAKSGLEAVKMLRTGGGTFSLLEREVQSGSLVQPDRALLDVTRGILNSDPWLFFPGMADIRAKRWASGLAVATTFSLSIAGGLYFEQIARRDSRASRRDPAYRLFGLGSYRRDFGRNLRKRNLLWVSALGGFAAHSIGLIFSRRWSPGTLELHAGGQKLGLGIRFPLRMQGDGSN